MITQEAYYYWPSFFNKKECEDIIKLGEKNKLENAHTAGGRDTTSKDYTFPQNLKTNYELTKNGELDKTYIRDSKVTWLDEQWLIEKVWKQVNHTNLVTGWKFDFDWAESMQFTKYEAPGGFYGYHQDGMGDTNSMYKRYIHGVTPVNLKDNGSLPSGYVGKNQSKLVGKCRKLSVTINLSDEKDYDGGELTFDIGEHHEVGKKIITNKDFKKQGTMVVFPSYMHHAVSPVTRGVRYSLVQWFLGRPIR